MIVPEKVFREYDIRGVVGEELTEEFVTGLGRSIGSTFESGSTLAVGFDARESSPLFNKLLTNGITETGCNVVQIGMVPTPVLYYILQKDHIDGGIMITGSHNPPDMNGFKICRGKFSLYGEAIQEIKSVMKEMKWRKSEVSGTVTKVEIIDEYTGEKIGNDQRALTYSITYQAPDRTLTDQEVDNVHKQVI